MIKAVVGAGGKTTHIHNAAKEYLKQGLKVLVTTSTHMLIEESMLLTDDAKKIIRELEENHYVMAGIPQGEKFQSLSIETYEKVCQHADVVLIEADGSKHMPIKYPAEHEPVIYGNVDEIVVICGLHALGKPLKDVAHRMELVKECLQISENTIVEARHIQKLVMKRYVKPMKEKYPEKNVTIKATHNDSLYQRVIAKLIESGMDVSLVKEEWFHTQPELIICGGGHVSHDLAKMASCLDFHIKVIDDREEFANRERFSMADEVICDSFDNLKKHMVKEGYYVVVTRGHKDDFKCVSTILEDSYQYLGMIGSKNKVRTAFDNLRNAGVEEKLIETIHAPIGLNIGAKTPAEIAVSILAEIIQVKNQKSAAFISREMASVKEKGTLCIIVEKTGSTPRAEGSMMFVTDSQIIDTIGGGVIEHEAIEDARASNQVFVKEYDLDNGTAESLGMICGGRNKVLFVPL